MSRKRRTFTAKFKADLVIELLKGEKDLTTLAIENDIQPNLLRKWKTEFLDNAAVVFDDRREENLKEKLSEECKEKSAYAKKVGQLTMQVEYENIREARAAIKEYIRVYNFERCHSSINNMTPAEAYFPVQLLPYAA